MKFVNKFIPVNTPAVWQCLEATIASLAFHIAACLFPRTLMNFTEIRYSVCYEYVAS